MKNINIRLTDVEAAMANELLKQNKNYKNLKEYIIAIIRVEHEKSARR